MRYDGSATLREARQLYFEHNGFADGGYRDRWVKLQAGPIPIYFPNTPARVRAVQLHDLHHTATEYDTTWTGEAEIAAWEIASGCGRHYAAWLLNLEAMAIGLAIAPREVFAAFVRGRASNNLYAATLTDALLDRRLDTLRHELGLDRPAPLPTLGDRVRFGAWCIAAVLTAGLLPALVVGGLAVWLR
jgi:hypothetical protein